MHFVINQSRIIYGSEVTGWSHHIYCSREYFTCDIAIFSCNV